MFSLSRNSVRKVVIQLYDKFGGCSIAVPTKLPKSQEEDWKHRQMGRNG